MAAPRDSEAAGRSTYTPDQFLNKLARGKPVPAVVLHGSDLYLRDVCREKLEETLLPEGAREWGVARFSLREISLDRVLQQAQMRPMLSPRQLLYVEDLDVLETLGDASRDAAVDQLASYLDDPADFTSIIFIADQLDQRMKLWKVLSEGALIVDVSLRVKLEARSAAVVAMTLRMARELGVTLERDAAEDLAEVTNGELARIRMELEKLATFVGERKHITSGDIGTLVVSAQNYSVWELADVLAAGNRKRALVFLESVLRQGEQPAAIVGALAWMFRKLLAARELPAHLPKWQAASALGMRPDTAELALKQSRKIPRERMVAGLMALYEADNRLKSGVVDDRGVLEFLVARL